MSIGKAWNQCDSLTVCGHRGFYVSPLLISYPLFVGDSAIFRRFESQRLPSRSHRREPLQCTPRLSQRSILPVFRRSSNPHATIGTTAKLVFLAAAACARLVTPQLCAAHVQCVTNWRSSPKQGS